MILSASPSMPARRNATGSRTRKLRMRCGLWQPSPFWLLRSRSVSLLQQGPEIQRRIKRKERQALEEKGGKKRKGRAKILLGEGEDDLSDLSDFGSDSGSSVSSLSSIDDSEGSSSSDGSGSGSGSGSDSGSDSASGSGSD